MDERMAAECPRAWRKRHHPRLTREAAEGAPRTVLERLRLRFEAFLSDEGDLALKAQSAQVDVP